MKREKYHEMANELLAVILDQLGGPEHTPVQIMSEFCFFVGIFQDLVTEIHDDERWPGRPPIQVD
jgi:hypothetical protein